jgi:secreted Zn-dependent insulinase-like peptidase
MGLIYRLLNTYYAAVPSKNRLYVTLLFKDRQLKNSPYDLGYKLFVQSSQSLMLTSGKISNYFTVNAMIKPSLIDSSQAMADLLKVIKNENVTAEQFKKLVQNYLEVGQESNYASQKYYLNHVISGFIPYKASSVNAYLKTLSRKNFQAYLKNLLSLKNASLIISGEIPLSEAKNLSNKLTVLENEAEKITNEPPYEYKLKKQKNAEYSLRAEVIIPSLMITSTLNTPRPKEKLCAEILKHLVVQKLYDEFRYKRGLGYYFGGVSQEMGNLTLFTLETSLYKENVKLVQQNIIKMMLGISSKGLSKASFDQVKSYFEYKMTYDVNSPQKTIRYIAEHLAKGYPVEYMPYLNFINDLSNNDMKQTTRYWKNGYLISFVLQRNAR